MLIVTNSTRHRGRSGRGGLASLADSFAEILAVARDLGPFDVVGHSQGGLHALLLADRLPGAVGHVVLLGSPVTGVAPIGARGSTLAHRPGLRTALDAVLGPSARAQVVGSGALPDIAPVPGVRYLLVVTDDDRTVPTRTLPSWLPVVRVQDRAPGARVSHKALVSDPHVLDIVADELTR